MSGFSNTTHCEMYFILQIKIGEQDRLIDRGLGHWKQDTKKINLQKRQLQTEIRHVIQYFNFSIFFCYREVFHCSIDRCFWFQVLQVVGISLKAYSIYNTQRQLKP